MTTNLRANLPTAGLIVFCVLLFFPALAGRDLTSSHEARAAQNAQMILDEGHWLVPRHFDRHLELQKPPLFYWCVALIGWLKGGVVDAWAVRLPSALSALACVLFLYFLGLRSQRPRAGLMAALILASCLHFTWLARVGRIDMPLTAAITFALGAFHLGNLDGAAKIRWHAFGYAALGVGLLLKGPIAVVLPAVVVGAAWLLRDRRWQAWTTLWWGVPLSLAIAAPWYVWANWRTDNQLWEVFFWYHNVERGLGGSETLSAHPWWFYGPRTLVDLLPWSLLAPIAVYGLIRTEEIRKDKDVCLGLTWFAAMLLFLSCMSFKRADYLLPAYPGLAIFLGACIETWWKPEPDAQARDSAPSLACASGSVTWVRNAFLAVLIAYAAGWLIYSGALSPPDEKPYRAMAEEIRRQTPGPVIFFRAEAHLLTYHVGQPVATILEWENLEVWANKPGPIFVVMPTDCANQWREYLPGGSLREVLRSTDYVADKHSFVVLRNRAD